ncbi:MAG: SH3 domain-containing protein [Clostridia bacterium]|nr:SH3 domain-containing protein [Clostridia bacterium]
MKSIRNCRKISFGALICALALIICFMAETTMIASAAEIPAGSIAVVTADTKLNLRQKPQGKIIGKIAHGKLVTILSEIDRNGYYRIRVNETGLECYAYGEYLKLLYEGTANQEPTINIPEQDLNHDDDSNENVPMNAILVVTCEGKLNMRKKPTRKADRIKYLYYGARLQVVSSKVKNNYVLVRDLEAGKLGYVSLDYVAFEEDVNLKQCIPENCCPNCICQTSH